MSGDQASERRLSAYAFMVEHDIAVEDLLDLACWLADYAAPHVDMYSDCDGEMVGALAAIAARGAIAAASRVVPVDAEPGAQVAEIEEA